MDDTAAPSGPREPADRRQLESGAGPRQLVKDPVISSHGQGPRPHPLIETSLEDEVVKLAWQAEKTGVASHVGIYLAQATPDGHVLARFRAEESFPAASVIKVPVMIAVWRHLIVRPDSAPRTIEQLERTIRYSDNEATNALIDALGGFGPVNAEIRTLVGKREPITKLVTSLGGSYRGSSPPNRACPAEIGQMLVDISTRDREGELPARGMLELMRSTSLSHRTRIPQGVPGPFRELVANKTGTLTTHPVVNDAAIIQLPNGERYVLCIFLEGVKDRLTAEGFCQQVSRTSWRALAGPDFQGTKANQRPSEGVRQQIP